jgi:hypothetical protein
MIYSDPDEAHKKGCCEVYSNVAKRFAPVAGVDEFVPGLYPKENLERIARAVEHKDRIAQEKIRVLVEAVNKGKITLRFPRERN